MFHSHVALKLCHINIIYIAELRCLAWVYVTSNVNSQSPHSHCTTGVRVEPSQLMCDNYHIVVMLMMPPKDKTERSQVQNASVIQKDQRRRAEQENGSIMWLLPIRKTLPCYDDSEDRSSGRNTGCIICWRGEREASRFPIIILFFFILLLFL